MNTSPRRTIAIAAVGSTAAGALLLGAAAPAFAHGSASDPATAAQSQFTPPTLDQQKTWIENVISYWQQELTNWGQKVANSTTLTDAQKATYASQLASAEQALSTLKASVAAATTEDQLRTALRDGWAQVHFPTWPGAWRPHLKHAKWDPDKRHADLQAARRDADRSDPAREDRAHWDPARWDAHRYAPRTSGSANFGAPRTAARPDGWNHVGSYDPHHASWSGYGTHTVTAHYVRHGGDRGDFQFRSAPHR